jgi:uncharacterized protein (TIGR03437 family)
MNLRFLVGLCGAWTMASAQPPAVGQNGVVNAASQIPTTLPGAAIARGARFEIAGVRLARSGTLRVKLEHNGSTLLAPVRQSEPTKIEALMPRDAPLGKNTLIVETDAGRSKAFLVEIAATRIGLYSLNQKGWGPGKIDILSDRSRRPNSVSAPARPGQLLAISSTGLGDGRGLKVVVGGEEAAVFGIDRNVEPGLDEIRFRVPRNVTEGCYVPLYARVPGAPVSNVVTVSIESRASRCRMPANNAVPPIDEQHIGVLGIGRATTLYADDRPRTTMDEAYGAFLDFSHPGVQSSPLLLIPPEGTCTAYTGSYQSGVPSFRSFPDALLGMLEGRGMSAGRSLSLGDEPDVRVVPETGRGSYWVRLGLEEPGLRSNRPLFFKNPAYPFSGSGGEEVEQFVRRISAVSAFDWLNEREAATIQRDRGFSIQWANVTRANVLLVLAVSVDPLTTATALGFCSAKPEASRLRLPKEIFTYFPQTKDIPGPASSLFFIVAARLENALPPAVRGLDQLWTISSFTRGRRLEYH